LKVLHVEAGRHLYGGALQVAYLVRGLEARGTSNVVACPPGSGLGEALRGSGARLLPVRMGGDLDLPLVLRLLGVIRRERPDLVHLHSRRGADVLGGLACRLAGVPAVHSRRVDNPEPRPLARLKYRLFRKVITISEGIAEVLRGEGVPPERIVTVPSAVDTGRFRPGGDRPRFLADFGLPAGARVAGVVAQLIPRKGHRFALEILPGLLARWPELRLLFFGKGPLEADLRQRVRREGLGDRVLFCGFRGDLERVLPCLDVLLHPALMEGLGVSLLQAAACAVPIVAFRAGGVPEVVRHGRNGLLVEPGDAEGLGRCLERLLADPDEARAMGREGRRIVEADFSIPSMVEGNLAVYRQVLAGAP